MAEDAIIRQELDQFTIGLLERGLSGGWIGLELMTLGICMLTNTLGESTMALHLRRISEQYEKGTQLAHSDNGYSAIG